MTRYRDIKWLSWLTPRLELVSGPGARVLFDLPWLTCREALEEESRLTRVAMETLADAQGKQVWDEVGRWLMQVNDIRNTLLGLEGDMVPDDIGLFEIKGLAMACSAIGGSLPEVLPGYLEIPDLKEVSGILDPDGMGAASFHIYNSYSERLADLRREYAAPGLSPEEKARLMDMCLAEESRVRKDLAARLKPYVGWMLAALEGVGHLDLIRAKSLLALNEGMTLAEVSAEGSMCLEGIWNPVAKEALSLRGGRYQPVDFEAKRGVTLLTGANMSGKTVVLKTLAICQAMFQLGFPLPAAKAVLPVKDSVLVSIGDSQSEGEGLSSYAAEMLRIDGILKSVGEGTHLVLVDEPARTTNPEEGEALVCALVEMLGEADSISVVTTHYSTDTPARRLRVKGLANDLPAGLAVGALSALMDYSLVPDAGEPPREALRVASLLGINGELIRLSSTYIKKRQDAKK